MVAPKKRLSAAEYLAWEREQPEKHEFFHGEVFAMAGASTRHNAICTNVLVLLHPAAVRRGCFVLPSDQRTMLDDGERYVYPDVSLICGKPATDAHENLRNPTVIVEVLSRSTEQNDRGSKWQSYQQLASLTDYVLVPQWEPRLEHYRRDPRGGWSYISVGPGQRITLTDGTELAVDDVFARVMDLEGDTVPPATA